MIWPPSFFTCAAGLVCGLDADAASVLGRAIGRHDGTLCAADRNDYVVMKITQDGENVVDAAKVFPMSDRLRQALVDRDVEAFLVR